MTQTDVRETLVAVEAAVDVPPMDEAAVRRLGRAERRRRGLVRGAVAVGAAGVVAAGVAFGMTGWGGTDEASPADSPISYERRPSTTVSNRVPSAVTPSASRAGPGNVSGNCSISSVRYVSSVGHQLLGSAPSGSAMKPSMLLATR